MIGEVIAIGDELTSGARLDTNSQWLSRRLTELGIRVGFHTTIADDLPASVAAFRIALERADFVISSGGLGPTADDLTREALAEATGAALQLDEQALSDIKALFARRGREMPQRNEVQALFPVGSQVIPNPHGSAPGIAMQIARPERTSCFWYSLPGVPAELFEMWEATVGPAVARASGRARFIRHRTVKCFGVGESQLEQMLPDLIRRGRTPSVGITVHEGTISLRITAEGPTEAKCLASMDPTCETIRTCLGNLIFGAEEDELEHAVARLLAERKQTLATVEIGTAGLVAHWLSNVADLRPWYLGGIQLPTPRAAAPLLEIPAAEWNELDPTSAAAAERLATAIRADMHCDLALAVSDVPHVVVGGKRDECPEEFYVALATPDGVWSRGFSYAAHPAIMQALAAKRALNYLRLSLEPGQNSEWRSFK